MPLRPATACPPLRGVAARALPNADTTDAQLMAKACKALWIATLGLMAAYLQQRELTERQALAQRIAANFKTLHAHSDCFAPRCRDSFERLALRWSRAASRGAAPGDPRLSRPLSQRH